MVAFRAVGLLNIVQLETRSHTQLLDTLSNDNVATKVLPSEKPLPSPPMAQSVIGSPVKEARCLVDASEKPLRRSPPGKPHQEEEWPVLFPEKPTTPATLRELHSQETHEPLLRLTLHDEEKHPALANLQVSSAKAELSATGNSFSDQPIQRKPVPTEESVQNLSVSLKQQDLPVQTFPVDHDGLIPNVPAKVVNTPTISDPRSPFNLSASASALEKLAQESRKFPEPRPTRTSSLRARISTGNLTTNTRVVGFTDFTTVEEGSGITEQGTLQTPNDSLSLSKVSSQSTAPGKKPSLGPVRANRGPAKYVAGSRRPAVPHRPNSRGSLRGEAHDRSTADGNSPLILNTPGLTTSKICEIESVKNLKDQSEPRAFEQRRSSIPLFRGVVRNGVDYGEDNADITKLAPTVTTESKHRPQRGFNVFNDRKSVTSSATVASTVCDARYKQKQCQEPHSRTKKAVRESPRSNYQTKRLSMTSPEHGPTLRISPSAERLIMGQDTNVEDQQNLKKKQSNDLHRTVVTKELRKTVADVELGSGSRGYGVSSHMSASLPQSRPRVYIMDDDIQPKEEETTATGHALPSSRPDLGCSGRKNAESLSNEDPFLDTQAYLSHHSRANAQLFPAATAISDDIKINADTPKDIQEIISVDEASWISPMPKKVSSLRLSDAMPVAPAFLPVSMLEHVHPSVPGETLADHTYSTQRVQKFVEAKPDDAMVPEGLLSAPKHPDQDRLSTSPGDFPPRSSSRVQAHDYTLNITANNSSPVLPTDLGKHQSHDFRSRQNKLGEEFGWGSEQLDFTKPNAKRDSIARESYKSQGSQSKGVLSNFRELFHMRSGDTPELRPSGKVAKKGKGKISITSKGSPFPPISEVHPIHRPTLASSSKNRAANSIDRTPLSPRAFSSRNNNTTEVTPAFQSPAPTEICTTTALALQVIDSARLEPSSPKRDRLLELGQMLVDTLAQAREAQKAMEEAKHAARRAEVSYMLCKKSVHDVAKCVEKWGKNSGVGRM